MLPFGMFHLISLVLFYLQANNKLNELKIYLQSNKLVRSYACYTLPEAIQK